MATEWGTEAWHSLAPGPLRVRYGIAMDSHEPEEMSRGCLPFAIED